MPASRPKQRKRVSSDVVAETPERSIYAVVKAIPRGFVATYGEVAELAGIPAGHRVVARAMQRCPETLPWQRVIGKKDARRGQINIQDSEHATLQRRLLEAESVAFDANGFILLRKSGWLPR
jgi:methylated-DNA-protein-cysteine methyltransferase-like protein